MKKLVYLFLALLAPIYVSAQGLELSDDTIFKDEAGKTISLEKFQEYIGTGDYSIDPKQNASGKVIQVGLIKLTEDDKIMANRLIEVKNEAEGFPITPFEATTIDGKNYNSTNLNGKVTVIKFWFKDCAPCIAEIPRLNKLVSNYANNPDVDFLSFALDSEDAIRNFLRRQPFDYDIVASAQPVQMAMNINGFPTHIVVNKEGIVSEYVQGGLLHIERELEQAIEVALGNRAEEEVSGALQPAEINDKGEAVGFIIEPTTIIKNEAGAELNFDQFMKLMDTGEYVPSPAKTASGKDCIILKKKS